MSEVADACQVIIVSGRLIAGSAKFSVKAAMLLVKIYNSLYLGKWKGKTSFMRFRAIKGEEFEFINICSEDAGKLAAIEKEMEAHNLLFSRLPDLCGGDGNTQYVIARSDMNIFAAFLMDHIHGEHKNIKVGPIAESDYAGSAVHPESGEYTKEFKDLNASAKQEYASGRQVLSIQQRDQMLTLPFIKEEEMEKAAKEQIDTVLPGEPESLMISRFGQRKEISVKALLLDPQIRLRDEFLNRKDKLQLLYEAPIREGEKWAIFPIHDGFHVIAVPREDLLSGNPARARQHRAAPLEKIPTAMLFTDKNYVVMDLRSGEKSILDGKKAMELLSLPSPVIQRQELENLAKNIKKNVGDSALLPVMNQKHGGR